MPRLRKPLKTAEEISAVPMTEEVEIDLSAIEETPPKAEAQDSKGNGVDVDAKPDPVVVPVAEKDDESEALKKRIAELEAAEKAYNDRLAAAQQREQEALKRAQDERDKLTKATERANQSDYDSVINALSASQAEAEAAKRDIQAALVQQDPVAQSEAYDRLSRANARIVQFEDGKASLEAKMEEAKREPPKKDPPSDPLEAAISHLPNEAKVWVRAHPDYWTDQHKNAQIQYLHFEAIKAGNAAFSPGYFEFLEYGTGLKKKPEPEVIEDETTVAAPPTRESVSMSTGRKTDGSIKLTPEQREAAKVAGVDEITYAKGVRELERRKKLGMYQN